MVLGRATRALAFCGVCVPLRLGLACAPLALAPARLPWLGALVGASATATLYLAWTSGRLRAPEGGGRTWWAPYRSFHGALLLAASICLLCRDRGASLWLLADVAVGVALFLRLSTACPPRRKFRR